MIKWNNVLEVEPIDTKPVFLNKTADEDLTSAIVGHLIRRNSGGEDGWFVGNQKIITLQSREFWIYAEESDLEISDTENEAELEAILTSLLSKLMFFDKKFQKLAAGMITSGRGLYTLDYYVAGVLNRSLSLISAFESLITTRNYIGAAHLVRPHLDNYLRLSAAWLVDNPHEFAKKVWEGESVRNIKDRTGKKMTDAYLMKQASFDFPWIEDVYKETSAFVHFSNKHIMNATKIANDQTSPESEMSFQTFIGASDNQVSIHARIEATHCMIEISNCITHAVFGWIDTKRVRG